MRGAPMPRPKPKSRSTLEGLHGADVDRHAAKMLGCPNDWIVCFSSSEIDFIRDNDDVMRALGEEFGRYSKEEIWGAVSDALQTATLPKGHRLVGMRPSDEPGHIRRYGVVDFSELGAA